MYLRLSLQLEQAERAIAFDQMQKQNLETKMNQWIYRAEQAELNLLQEKKRSNELEQKLASTSQTESKEQAEGKEAKGEQGKGVPVQDETESVRGPNGLCIAPSCSECVLWSQAYDDLRNKVNAPRSVICCLLDAD